MRFFSILIFISLASCETNVDSTSQKSNLLLRSIKPVYAKGFEINYFSDHKQIILFNLELSGDTLQVIDWKNQEAKSVACLSTTHIAVLNKLGLLDKVKAVGFADMVRNPDAKKLIETGAIKNLSSGEDIDKEILISIKPDVFFVYPFGGASYEDYDKLGIPCIQVSEYLEEDPLGRAEWIKLFAAFFDEEEKADSVFLSIEKNYNSLKEQVANEIGVGKRPTVFTGSSQGGIWNAPPGNSFVAHLLKDAGASYIYEERISTGNFTLQFEEIFSDAQDCDYWGKVVYEDGELTSSKITDDDPRFTSLKCFRNKNIFYCNASESDYFGDALMEPDILLSDLVKIFHPETIPQHNEVYFRKIRE